MSPIQLIILGIGILIVLTSIDFSYIKNAITTSAPAKPLPVTNDELVSIVQKWQALKTSCEKNKLTEASNKLDEIFPMLIKTEKL